MYKYISVNKIVMKVTDNEALRTFFTLYLMEDDALQREALDKQFWAELDKLPNTDRVAMRENLKSCFKKLPDAITEWEHNVDSFLAANIPKAA